MATERVGIEVSILGYDEAIRQMKSVEKAVSGFRGKNAKIQLDDGRVVTVNQRIKELKQNIEALKSAKAKIKSQDIITDADKAKLAQMNKELATSRAELGRLQTAAQSAGRSLRQTFNGISSQVAHIGGAMQSMGNALSRLSNPIRSLMRGTVFAAGYKLFDLATGGIAGATERADTFRTYSKSLEALGYDATKKFAIGTNEAKDALTNLEDSVLGLPTGLDEIVASQKKYLAASGDMVTATKAAIAANNIFLAQGSDQKDQLRGARQIRNLLSGGEMTAARWQSLLESMPMAVNEVGKYMRKNGDFQGSMAEFRKALLGGDIDQNKFLNALLEVGTSGRIRDAVEETKHTYSAVTANITNAFRRMGENVLKTLDDILVKATGKDTIDWMLELKKGIDSFSEGLQGWIRKNPEVFTRFLDEMRKFDWKGLAEGIGEGLVWSLNRLYDVMHLFSRLDTGLLGKIMGGSGFAGSALTILGGMVKGLRHPAAGIGVLFKVLTQGLRGLGSGGVKEGVKSIGQLGEAVKTDTDTPKLGKFSAALSSFFKGWAEIAVMVGGSALVGWGSIKLIKNAFKDIRELGEIVGEIDWGHAATGLIGAADFIAALIGVGKLIGSNPELMKDIGLGTLFAGLISVFGSGVFATDMELIKSGFKSIYTSAEYVNKTIEELNKITSINDVGGVKTKVRNAITAFNQIKDLFRGGWDQRSGQWEGGLDKFPRSIRKSVENIAETIGNMETAITTLNKLADMKIDTEKIEGIATPFKDALSSLRSAILQIPSQWKEKDIVDATGNLSASLGNLKTSFESIAGKNGILSQIPQLIQQSTGFQQYGVYKTFADRVGEIGTALKDAYNALNKGIGNGEYMSTNLDNFRQALKSAKFALLHLQAISKIKIKDDAVKNIQDSFGKIKEAFNVDTINEIKEPIDTFKQTISDALASFDDLNKEIVINPKVKLGNDFKKGVNSTSWQITAANGKIQAAINGIKTNYYKQVNIRIAVKTIISRMGDVGNTLQNIADQSYKNAKKKLKRDASGGPIYKAGGGWVSWAPRGTDTIPAMLTPGEYVQRRAAVRTFGKDFMDRVNNLDVEGAVRAMSARFGSRITNTRSTKITNIVNNNNNQTYSPNIYTNSERFMLKRGSRFAGAL